MTINVLNSGEVDILPSHYDQEDDWGVKFKDGEVIEATYLTVLSLISFPESRLWPCPPTPVRPIAYFGLFTGQAQARVGLCPLGLSNSSFPPQPPLMGQALQAHFMSFQVQENTNGLESDPAGAD